MQNEVFCKVNEKGEKNTAKKNRNGLAEKGLPCGKGSYNFEKDTKLQRENERYI